MSARVRVLLEEGLIVAGVKPDALQLELLSAYVELLGRFESAANLIGIGDPERIVEELIVDSLRLAPALTTHGPAAGAFIDVGSGAGLPGIPLAIMLPQWGGVLAEPRERRRTFLAMALRTLGLADRIDVSGARLEHAGFDRPFALSAADLLVSKAVFRPAEWLKRALPLARPDGLVGVFASQADRVDADAALAGLGGTWAAQAAYPTRAGVRVAALARGRAVAPLTGPSDRARAQGSAPPEIQSRTT